MSKKNFNQYIYEQWVYDAASNYVRNQCKSCEYLETYVAKNGYFLTATFDQKRIKERKLEKGITSNADTSIEMQNMRHFYIKLCKKLLGKNYNYAAKRELQPFCFLFVDAEASKYRKTFEASDLKNLHIHALVIFPKELKEKTKFLENSHLLKQTMLGKLDIDNIEFSPFDITKATVKRVTGYSSKLAVKSTTTGMDIEDLMIYPDHLHNRRPDVVKMKTRKNNIERLTAAVIKEKRKGKKYSLAL